MQISWKEPTTVNECSQVLQYHHEWLVRIEDRLEKIDEKLSPIQSIAETLVGLVKFLGFQPSSKVDESLVTITPPVLVKSGAAGVIEEVSVSAAGIGSSNKDGDSKQMVPSIFGDDSVNGIQFQSKETEISVIDVFTKISVDEDNDGPASDSNVDRKSDIKLKEFFTITLDSSRSVFDRGKQFISITRNTRFASGRFLLCEENFQELKLEHGYWLSIGSRVSFPSIIATDNVSSTDCNVFVKILQIGDDHLGEIHSALIFGILSAKGLGLLPDSVGYQSDFWFKHTKVSAICDSIASMLACFRVSCSAWEWFDRILHRGPDNWMAMLQHLLNKKEEKFYFHCFNYSHGVFDPGNFFAIAAAGITSGYIAERIQFVASVIFSAVLTGLVYTIVFPWSCSSIGCARPPRTAAELLMSPGAIDFAGASDDHRIRKRWLVGHWNVAGVGNGLLGSLTAFTAGRFLGEPRAAISCGFVISVVLIGCKKLVEKFRYDDPVEAEEVHGGYGIWGRILTTLFAKKKCVAQIYKGGNQPQVVSTTANTTPQMVGKWDDSSGILNASIKARKYGFFLAMARKNGQIRVLIELFLFVILLIGSRIEVLAKTELRDHLYRMFKSAAAYFVAHKDTVSSSSSLCAYVPHGLVLLEWTKMTVAEFDRGKQFTLWIGYSTLTGHYGCCLETGLKLAEHHASWDSATSTMSNRSRNSSNAFPPTAMGLNVVDRYPEVDNLNDSSSASHFEALPVFRDLHEAEKQKIFARKLTLCGVVFHVMDVVYQYEVCIIAVPYPSPFVTFPTHLKSCQDELELSSSRKELKYHLGLHWLVPTSVSSHLYYLGIGSRCLIVCYNQVTNFNNSAGGKDCIQFRLYGRIIPTLLTVTMNPRESKVVEFLRWKFKSVSISWWRMARGNNTVRFTRWLSKNLWGMCKGRWNSAGFSMLCVNRNRQLLEFEAPKQMGANFRADDGQPITAISTTVDRGMAVTTSATKSNFAKVVVISTQVAATVPEIENYYLRDIVQTAKAIALECGIIAEAEAPEPTLIEGKRFCGIYESEREEVAGKISVMGRSSSNDKLPLIKALRKGSHVFAETGEGTNDTLALKKNAIGLTMGIQRTEVTKESPGIIVLDETLASVVKRVAGSGIMDFALQVSLHYLLSLHYIAGEMFQKGAVIGVSQLRVRKIIGVHSLKEANRRTGCTAVFVSQGQFLWLWVEYLRWKFKLLSPGVGEGGLCVDTTWYLGGKRLVKTEVYQHVAADTRGKTRKGIDARNYCQIGIHKFSPGNTLKGLVSWDWEITVMSGEQLTVAFVQSLGRVKKHKGCRSIILEDLFMPDSGGVSWDHLSATFHILEDKDVSKGEGLSCTWGSPYQYLG